MMLSLFSLDQKILEAKIELSSRKMTKLELEEAFLNERISKNDRFIGILNEKIKKAQPIQKIWQDRFTSTESEQLKLITVQLTNLKAKYSNSPELTRLIDKSIKIAQQFVEDKGLNEQLSAVHTSYESLENTALIVNQLEQETKRFDQQRFLIELRKRDSLELLRQQAEIQALQTRIGELNNRSTSQISFDEILTEMRVISPFAREVRYAQTYISNFETIDTIAVFRIQWDSSLDSLAIASEEKRLRNWLVIQLPNRAFVLESD